MCGFHSLGLVMTFHMELDKACLGQISFLTCSQVTRCIAFLSPPSDNEMPLWALPECCLGHSLPLGTSSGTASIQAPAWCHLVDKNTPCATSSPGACAPPHWSSVYEEATQALKSVYVLLEASLCTEGVELASLCGVLVTLTWQQCLQ